MRIVIQRVSEASVRINNELVGQIDAGMLILLGIEEADDQSDADWLVQKVLGLRIFSDDEGKMNRSIAEINGRFLVVSQFTLHASTKKGNRPSYIRAARPEHAIPLYEYFVHQLGILSNTTIETGKFGADMKVSLLNDGPVTIIIDSKSRE
jgi:D-tyrosyl-tRNA(Tyr) deacylase